MENTLKLMLKEMKEMRGEMIGMRTDIKGIQVVQIGMKSNISELKTAVNRLEQGQENLQKNIVNSIGMYTDKIIHNFDDKTEALNKRVYRVETELENLKRQ